MVLLDEIRTKLNDKAKECWLIGFEGDSIYIVVDQERKKQRSQNVIFIEGTSHRNNEGKTLEFSNQEDEKENDSQGHEEEVKTRQTRSEVWGTEPSRRSERLQDPKTDNQVLITKVIEEENTPDIKIPQTYSQAVNSLEGKSWKDAMDYKLSKLKEMNTGSELNEADLPQGAQILLCMWVNTVKNLETGERKFQSRWVVRGDQQKVNLPLHDTFAPVSQITSLRILMALATLKDMQVFAWDIDSAYLHGKINHDVYVALPDGYEKPGKVGRLNKALYGLPEAAWVWLEDLETNLKELGFLPLGSDTV